ncbi:MAG TPA: hypothetical protein VFB38_22275 [Chthonomonadaceae bacterium]|nr:hypothetical protein [Chthonomonadaceae bacterium]
MYPQWMRKIALSLALLWACGWSFFAVASSIGEGYTWPKLLPGILAALVFVGSLLLAWQWEPIGGSLLILEGLLVCTAYATGFLHARSANTMFFVLLLLAAPAMVSGLLLLGNWWKRTRSLVPLSGM